MTEMPLERWGRSWECLRGYSVVEPKGWWFELRDMTDDPAGQGVLFAAWPEGGELTVTQSCADLSPEIVEWFTEEARTAIKPILEGGGS